MSDERRQDSRETHKTGGHEPGAPKDVSPATARRDLSRFAGRYLTSWPSLLAPILFVAICAWQALTGDAAGPSLLAVSDRISTVSAFKIALIVALPYQWLRLRRSALSTGLTASLAAIARENIRLRRWKTLSPRRFWILAGLGWVLAIYAIASSTVIFMLESVRLLQAALGTWLLPQLLLIFALGMAVYARLGDAGSGE